MAEFFNPPALAEQTQHNSPPLICLLALGKCGSGRSTTLDRLFLYDFTAGVDTGDPAITSIPAIHILSPHQTGMGAGLQIVEMPGIGVSLTADEAYMPFYVEWTPRADHLLWITQADTRAYKRDEMLLARLSPLFNPALRLTVGLNRVDCLGVNEGEPGFDWYTKRPSEAQQQQISAKIQDIFEVFQGALNGSLPFSREDIVPYSATGEWGITALRQRFFLQHKRKDKQNEANHVM